MFGGGQLGRYALMAARQMGFSTIVLDPDPNAPAGAVADEHLIAAFDDPAALDRMAERCSVITTEFENPPAAAVERVAARVPVRPNPASIAITQDRLSEKRFLHAQGLPVAPFLDLSVEPVGSVEHLLPGIVKTSRLGYDGRGQIPVAVPSEVNDACATMSHADCVLEKRLDLQTELSVMIARSVDGSVVHWPVAENRHVGGILDLSVVPAQVPPEIADAAVAMARSVVEALDYVGVLAVELFVVESDEGDQLVVNELAPRPHNSGHWTLDGSVTDQFSQQIRAVVGASLSDSDLTVPAVAMVNLLGDLWSDGEPDWSAVLAAADARLHLYGKATARARRKMGHLTVLGDDPSEVAARALELRSTLNSG